MTTTTISGCCCGTTDVDDCYCTWIWSYDLDDWVLDADNSTGVGEECGDSVKPEEEGSTDGEIKKVDCNGEPEPDDPSCDSGLECRFVYHSSGASWELIQEESCDANIPDDSLLQTCCPTDPEPEFWPELGFPAYANEGDVRTTPCQLGGNSDCGCGSGEDYPPSSGDDDIDCTGICDYVWSVEEDKWLYEVDTCLDNCECPDEAEVQAHPPGTIDDDPMSLDCRPIS